MQNKHDASRITVESIQSFWHWFQENDEWLRSLDSAAFAELRRRLSHFHPALTWEFEGEIHKQFGRLNGNVTLNVSADSKIEGFPAVLELVKHAPSIPGWKIQAFRSRALSGSFTFHGVELVDRDLHFTIERTNAKAHLTVFIPTNYLRLYNRRDLEIALTFLIEQKIGEVDYVTKLVPTTVYYRDNLETLPVSDFSKLAAAFDDTMKG